jgi:predicted ArsR family transcriptional regulator
MDDKMPYTKGVADSEIIAVFRDSSDPAFYASEIAEAIDYTVEGARNRLDRLVEEGVLERKKRGKRSVVYWLKDPVDDS